MSRARFLAGTLIVVSLAACGIQGRSVRTGPKLAARHPDCDVDVYLGEKPSRPYRVIGEVEASGSEGFTDLIAPMAIEVCRLGADALVDVHNLSAASVDQFQTSARGAVWVAAGSQRYHSVGYAIQYTDRTRR